MILKRNTSFETNATAKWGIFEHECRESFLPSSPALPTARHIPPLLFKLLKRLPLSIMSRIVLVKATKYIANSSEDERDNEKRLGTGSLTLYDGQLQ